VSAKRLKKKKTTLFPYGTAAPVIRLSNLNIRFNLLLQSMY